jgi:hypothetical protein
VAHHGGKWQESLIVGTRLQRVKGPAECGKPPKPFSLREKVSAVADG